MKEIAGPLELSTGGVNGRIVLLTQKLGLTSRLEISKWAMQHPTCLQPGVYNEIGLHVAGCRCESPWCTWARYQEARDKDCPVGCRCQGCVEVLALKPLPIAA